MHTPTTRKPLALAIALALSTGTAIVHAAELEEVIVTAQKREQDLQDTPIAVSAFGAEAIEQQGVKDISDVSQYAPNVEIAPTPGGSTGATIGIRGSVTVNPAVTWEPTVGIYVDGVFVAKNVGGLFDVAELERIEVLRGPQGTLYGKNTIGGAINLITRKPGEEFGGTIRLTGANYNYKEGFVSVDTGKLGDTAAFNVAMSVRKRDGFYKNINTTPGVADEFMKLDTTAMRIAGLFDINDQLEAYYTFDKNKKDNTKGFGQTETLASEIKRLDEGNSNGTGKDTSESYGHALTLTYDISDDIALKSITSYRDMAFNDIGDYDGTPQTIFHAERDFKTKQTSQEFQLIGKANSLDYVLGAFYFSEETEANNPFDFGAGGAVDNKFGVDGTSYALYGQADWYVNDKWTLTGGLRWTQEEKEAYIDRSAGGATLIDSKVKDKWKNISPTAVATYAINDDASVYLKAAQGWKAGGFNAEASDLAEFTSGYKEEKVTSYELGLKSRWMDNRLQINAAVFQNNLEDLQLSSFLGAYSQVSNAGEATIKGIELELLAALTDTVTANLNYGYLSGNYGSFETATGDHKDTAKFPYTPTNKASAGLQYLTNLDFGQLKARLDYSVVNHSYVYHDKDPAELTKVEGYKLVNARISVSDIRVGQDQTLEFALWGKNLTDEEYRLNGIPALPGTAVNYYGDPRTYGVDATLRF
ncbi:MAG: TonB-dependent receptor [Endozoicomonas sp.]